MEQNNLPAELKAMLDEKFQIVSKSTFYKNDMKYTYGTYSDYVDKVNELRFEATEFYTLGQSSMKQGAPSDEEIEIISKKQMGKCLYVERAAFVEGMKRYRDTYAAAKPEAKKALPTDEEVEQLAGRFFTRYPILDSLTESGAASSTAYHIRLCEAIKEIVQKYAATANKGEGNEVDWDEIQFDLETYISKNLTSPRSIIHWFRTNLHKYLKK